MAAPSHQEDEFKEALSAAVIALWAELPELIRKKLVRDAVLSTVLDAVDLGYRVVVTEDALCSSSDVTCCCGSTKRVILSRSRPLRRPRTLEARVFSSRSLAADF